MSVDLEKMIQSLADKTKKKNIEWKKVGKNSFDNLLDRHLMEGEVKEAYYTVYSETEDDVMVVGRFHSPKYVDESEYYIDEHYFLTMTDIKFDNATTFFDFEEDLSTFAYSFAVDVARLYRLAKLSQGKIEERINKWAK